MRSSDHMGRGLAGLSVPAAPPCEQEGEIRRAQLLSAMIEVAAERGYVGATVGRVAQRARMSRHAFYELYGGREDCFLAALEWGVERATGLMAQGAGAAGRSWREQVRGALAALLALFDAEPQLARACVIETLSAGPLILGRRARVLEDLARALRADAPLADRGQRAPSLSAEGVIGGALSAIHARLLEPAAPSSPAAPPDPADRSILAGSLGSGASSPTRPLGELLGQLMALIVLPYLGPVAAGDELVRRADR
jgi:AcrR family transcriptional regulator